MTHARRCISLGGQRGKRASGRPKVQTNFDELSEDVEHQLEVDKFRPRTKIRNRLFVCVGSNNSNNNNNNYNNNNSSSKPGVMSVASAPGNMFSCILGVLLVLLGVTSLITSSLATNLAVTTATADGNSSSSSSSSSNNNDNGLKPYKPSPFSSSLATANSEDHLEHYTLTDNEPGDPPFSGRRRHHRGGKTPKVNIADVGNGGGGGAHLGNSGGGNSKLGQVTNEELTEQQESAGDSELLVWLNESEHKRNKLKVAFNFSWPLRESASVVDGQLVLGALHMIHERSEEYMCGKVMDQGGIQALEAMLFTLDHVNGKYDRMLIPGVRIGVLAKDDCDTDIFGLEQALDFIRGE
ncbi:putative uncharacterized protein DDB_G0274535 [Aplysia californica]|uniref:Uncharacterized protein n=1 Tax=Aplysia californica TaxID=6500 RepID=A0ABM1W087_APLCA|nr:putative uncharacterized protein DDB_G0274535 [Aplysia californica]